MTTHKLPMHDDRPRLLARRAFIELAVGLVAFAALPACASTKSDGAAPGTDDADPRPTDLPTLGGAPDTPQGRALAAFCDTIVPGKHRDPTGAPGAIDVGAPALFFDPSLPAATYVGLLAVLLSSESQNRFGGREFVQLTPDERDQVIIALTRDDSPLELAIQLAKLAYFATAEAAAHVGYPGANGGYVNAPNFSFGRPMAKELTSDGNMP